MNLHGDELSFDLSAASWRRSFSDEKAFVHALAVRLEQGLPGLATVDWEKHFFSKTETLRRIRVTFENVEYRLEFDARRGVRTERGKVVRNINLKTEPMTLTEWLKALSDDLTVYAQTHEEARDQLERFLLQ